MKIVLDTNVLMVSLPSQSKYRKIFDALLAAKFIICISTEILMEYEEQLSKWFGIDKTEIHLTEIMQLQNIELITPSYNWHLIKTDVDDKKFCDCAIASNADYIITNDKHFNILKQIKFPKVNILNAEAFLNLL